MPKRRRQASARRVWALGRWRPTSGARTGLLRKNPPGAIDGFVLGPTTLIAHHACTRKGTRRTGANGRRNSDQAHLLLSSRSISPAGWASSLSNQGMLVRGFWVRLPGSLRATG